MPEAMQLAPWWRGDVAGQMGLESVPAQALAWGLYGPQTGVTTDIAAPNLELLAEMLSITPAIVSFIFQWAMSTKWQRFFVNNAKDAGVFIWLENMFRVHIPEPPVPAVVLLPGIL